MKLHVSSYNNSELLMNQTHLLKIYCRVDIFCFSKQSMNYTEPNINVNLYTKKKKYMNTNNKVIPPPPPPPISFNVYLFTMHILIFALAFHFFSQFPTCRKTIRQDWRFSLWQNDELEIKAKSNIAE